MRNLSDWIEANGQLIAGLVLLIFGLGVIVSGRVDIGTSEDVTGLPTRPGGLVAAVMGLVLLVLSAMG